MEQEQSIRSLKGIGEKTGKLFEKLGVETIDDLLHDYPRAYHTYEEPVEEVGELKEGSVCAIGCIAQKDASVRRFQRMQIITLSLRDSSGTLQLVWYNMPFLRTALKAGTYHIFCGKVIRKNGRLTMEQPEILRWNSRRFIIGIPTGN